MIPEPAPLPLTFAVASSCLPNLRGRRMEDRFACGSQPQGAWAVVADGIGGGPLGKESAAVAVAAAINVLAGGQLDERTVHAAVTAAHVAVQALVDGADGGTTLTVAALTPKRLVVAAVGDSPALALTDDGGLHRLTPPRIAGGQLDTWIGQTGALSPFLDSWPVPDRTLVVVCSDGVDLERVSRVPDHPEDAVEALLQARNDDDVTGVALASRPLLTPAEPSETTTVGAEHAPHHTTWPEAGAAGDPETEDAAPDDPAASPDPDAATDGNPRFPHSALRLPGARGQEVASAKIPQVMPTGGNGRRGSGQSATAKPDGEKRRRPWWS